MYKAYIKCDPFEDPNILFSLCNRLRSKNIIPITTEKSFKEINDLAPFLYFRNPYIRIDNELEIIIFHHNNPNLPYITTKNKELISYNPTVPITNHSFITNNHSTIEQPNYDPLPILIGTYRRSVYFKLTLNSILYNNKDKNQAIYIVASDPDSYTRTILDQLIKDTNIEIIISDNNLGYSLFNFGSKYFNLKKFIHFEDDAILPESTNYHLPFWTRQMGYRSKTADVVGFRISEDTWNANFFTSDLMYRKNILKMSDALFQYFPNNDKFLMPIGGMGLVIDSARHYKNFEAPTYASSDQILSKNAKNYCLINLPIYHIGANQDMDYPDYAKNKRALNLKIDKLQTGFNLRTGEKFSVDLSQDWKDKE